MSKVLWTGVLSVKHDSEIKEWSWKAEVSLGANSDIYDRVNIFF